MPKGMGKRGFSITQVKTNWHRAKGEQTIYTQRVRAQLETTIRGRADNRTCTQGEEASCLKQEEG